IKGDARAPVFSMTGFGDDIGDNFKEFFRPSARGPVDSTLLVNWDQSASLWQNLRDMISPPKLPPLNVTSKPVAVKEIWSKNTQFTRVQSLSIAFHILVLVLIIVPLLPQLMSPGTTKANSIVNIMQISPYLPKLAPAAKKAGGGGGQRNLTPAVHGQAPKFSWTQFSKPLAKPPVDPPTLVGNPDIKVPNITAQNWGDPLSKVLGGDSLGQGSGNGIGNGQGNGLGPGYGYNTGGGYPNAGTGGYGSPACLYCPQPQFSDEAVKAKYQGTVLLVAVITADGRATEIRVAKGLGLGLSPRGLDSASMKKPSKPFAPGVSAPPSDPTASPHPSANPSKSPSTCTEFSPRCTVKPQRTHTQSCDGFLSVYQLDRRTLRARFQRQRFC
ncbi:MAG: energy transducer TonB, partial [Candidatus Acidiferrales bacterium]